MIKLLYKPAGMLVSLLAGARSSSERLGLQATSRGRGNPR
jgi:hypothetical protein